MNFTEIDFAEIRFGEKRGIDMAREFKRRARDIDHEWRETNLFPDSRIM